jgi:hypothetical protein
MKYYVYAYLLPDSSVPFYIGKGSGNRCYAHLSPCNLNRSKTPFHLKIKQLLSDGIRPRVKKLAKNLSNDEAVKLEKYYIASLGRIDIGAGLLYNGSSGGESGRGLAASKVS